MASYEALNGRNCMSASGWFEVEEANLFGPDLVHQAIEKQVVHPVFHVSMLRKCIRDPSKIVPFDDLQVTENLTCEEEPIAILDPQVRRLKNKEVASVKVLWRSKDWEEMTWDAEAEIMSKYPHLFPVTGDTIKKESLQGCIVSANNLQDLQIGSVAGRKLASLQLQKTLY
ncbi:uncharacterized protein LOC132064195 [Lycium ferocissimum]|uniref:uncharacterized protein LOC132064195 n=1 Tax=Lycium ferocissimum TaxID=112874 RepID=UPI002814FF4F|nr:uncharacterized protein LOC132064195 [Lycium ferocissimum]